MIFGQCFFFILFFSIFVRKYYYIKHKRLEWLDSRVLRISQWTGKGEKANQKSSRKSYKSFLSKFLLFSHIWNFACWRAVIWTGNLNKTSYRNSNKLPPTYPLIALPWTLISRLYNTIKLPSSRSNQFKTIDLKDLEGSIIAWLSVCSVVRHSLLMRFSRLPLTSQSRQVQS